MQLDFTLHPFEPVSAPPVTLTGFIVHRPPLLRAEIRLSGPLHTIAVPPAEQPQRRHELWKNTCFEFFFSAADVGAYHEINLSPAGHWNHYRFDAYRKGMREEAKDCLKRRTLQITDILVVRLEIDLGRLGLGNKALHVNLCAVLLSQERIHSYWAISHPGPKPDFHYRKPWPLLL